eukprot:2727080-Prymnesium_polylepis.1
MLVTPITSVCFTRRHGLVLCGVGHTLHIYDAASGELLCVEAVLQGGEALHGISTHAVGSADVELLLLHGIRELRLHSLDVGRLVRCRAAAAEASLLVPLLEWRMQRRVLALGLARAAGAPPRPAAEPAVDSLVLAAGCDDNVLSLWPVGQAHGDGRCELDSTRGFTRAPPPQRVGCSHRSVLYAMALQPLATTARSQPQQRDGAQMLVASGSAFMDITVWDGTPRADGALPSADGDAAAAETERPPLYKLVGHAGAVFSLSWALAGPWLASCSDDRRVLLWHVPAQAPADVGASRSQAQTEALVPAATAGTTLAPFTWWFAHSARVWQCCWVEQSQQTAAVASAGE